MNAHSYNKDLDLLRSEIGALQKDLSNIIGTVGMLSGHGLEDLRAGAFAGDGLQRQGQHLQRSLYRNATRLESTLEGAIRQQPALAIAIATAALAVAVTPLVVRRH